jgi:hypothetical protein
MATPISAAGVSSWNSTSLPPAAAILLIWLAVASSDGW